METLPTIINYVVRGRNRFHAKVKLTKNKKEILMPPPPPTSMPFHKQKEIKKRSVANMALHCLYKKKNLTIAKGTMSN